MAAAQSGACAKGKESQWPDHRGAAGISWLRLASDVPHHVFVASLGTVASAGLPPRKKVALRATSEGRKRGGRIGMPGRTAKHA